AAALVFILMRLVPGDVCVIRLGSGGAHLDAGALKLCRDQLGLDNPVIVQFLDFLRSYVTFDFGKSMWSGNPVSQEILSRLPVSLEVALLATVIAILLAIPLGTLSALRENTVLDHVVRVLAIAGIATPSFWLGIMSLILVLRSDFGKSMWSGNPVSQEILSRLPVSLEVALLATVIAILLAIPLGTLSALRENTVLDHVVRVLAIAGIATPSFWLGIMSLILVL